MGIPQEPVAKEFFGTDRKNITIVKMGKKDYPKQIMPEEEIFENLSFAAFENFSNSSSRRRNRFGPKLVKKNINSYIHQTSCHHVEHLVLQNLCQMGKEGRGTT